MRTSSIHKSVMLVACGLLLATQPGLSCLGGSDDAPGETINGIPRDARVVREGTGDLEYTADSAGTIYVQDLPDVRTVVTSRIRSGQRLRVMPGENRVRLDDRTLSEKDLTSDHEHRIYLLRDRDARDRDDDRDDDRNDDRGTNDVGGSVPSGARLMGEGTNEEISFKAARSGRVFVYDADARDVVATADIDDGERFVFSPGAGRATVDGKRVIERDFDTRKNYRVYLGR